MSTYLDYNASTPISPEVLNVMVDVYRNHFGNADSRTHDFGENARQIVDNARSQVASLLGVSKDEVFFTSGSTESNNIAIQGLEEFGNKSNKRHIITTGIEHHAVLKTAIAMKERGFDVEVINPDQSGRVKTQDILSALRDDTLLVSVMHVNNETGIIQPVYELGDELEKKGILFHIDATQSCGKMVEEVKQLKYNMLSLSAHKLQGPQGIGALILRKKRYKLPPVKGIMFGGQQEHSIRPGTTPVALAAGLGKACQLSEMNYLENSRNAKLIKRKALELLEKSGVLYEINGDQTFCIDTTLNVSFTGVASEALMISSKQYCGISNGSACTSKSYEPSYVLTAMGLPRQRVENAVRISWGPSTNLEQFEQDFGSLINVVENFQ